MVTMSPSEELNQLLSDGPVQDIYRFEQALALYRTIEDNAKFINSEGFGEFFAAVQNYAVMTIGITICRMFEPISTRYRQRSFGEISRFIEENSKILTIRQRIAIVQFINIKDTGQNDQELTIAFIKHLEQLLPDINKKDTCTLSNSLDRARYFRDKKLAHNEVSEEHEVMFADLEALATFAKSILDVIGSAYLSTCYRLKTDAQRASWCLRRLMDFLHKDISTTRIS